MPAETLVLWDVDLTLLDLRRMGGGWFTAAIVEVTGREPVNVPAFGGRTDRWIAARLPQGTASTEASPTSIRLPPSALAMPPTASPTGAGRFVKCRRRRLTDSTGDSARSSSSSSRDRARCKPRRSG